MSNPIPLFYRIVFTYVDPMFCITGVYQHLFDARKTAASYSPTMTNVGSGAQHILDNVAAFYAYLFVMEAILLRVRGGDTTVWRIVQGAGMVLDAVMTVGGLRMLSAEGRLADVGSWSGDDRRYVFGNGVFGVLRLACVLGVGMRR